MMTVSDVRKLYNIPKDYINAHRSSNSQAVANFLNISVNHNDTKLFQKVMAIRPQPAVRSEFLFRGAGSPQRIVKRTGTIPRKSRERSFQSCRY